MMDAPIGSPPTLEWIGVERLAIDESYQRATDSSRSRRLICRIKEGWNWALCQPLVVSRRADNGLYVIDGQHRLSAALERGDIPHLPCVVLSGQDSADEAGAFVALNTQRQRLSQSDIFNAMLAAGDEAAKDTAAILEETGWTITRNNSIQTAGRMNSAPMVARAVRSDGPAVVRNALTALREAYPDQPVSNCATLLKALFLVYRENLASHDPDALIETLGAVEPGDWELHGSDTRRDNPALTRVSAIAEAILAAYRETVRSEELGIAA